MFLRDGEIKLGVEGTKNICSHFAQAFEKAATTSLVH